MPAARSASSQSAKPRSRTIQAPLDPHDLAEGGIELDPAPPGTQPDWPRKMTGLPASTISLRDGVHPFPGFAHVGG